MRRWLLAAIAARAHTDGVGQGDAVLVTEPGAVKAVEGRVTRTDALAGGLVRYSPQ